MDNKRRKQILDKLRRSNQIFDLDYNSFEKDLEMELENEFRKKKDELISLLYEKELLKLKIENSLC
ncbi:hypothetical protein [Aquimarina sp. AU58]|uniref:hypothetical protein n=1 Tax=Aquimarina sp. AU58 TaxID=1874112 RepID=UPI000D65B6DC|nr:hypothetical protein [Aquimarina sp. AU58]